MKKFSITLFLTLALLASVATSQTLMTGSNLQQFAQGVVRVLTAQNVDLQACINSEQQVAQVILNGIQAFEQKTEKGILDGLSIIGSSFETIGEAIKQCNVLKIDIENFIQKIRSFSNIGHLIFEDGKKLIVDGVEIFQEIHTAVNEYKHQEYTQAGEQFGYALEKIFQASQQSMKSEQSEFITIPKDFKMDAIAFLIGFLESLGNQDDISSLTDIATCVTPNALFSVEEVVYSTIGQIENTTDYTQVKPIVVAAIKQLGQAFEQIPDDLVSCGISQTLIDRVKQFISLCKNTKQLESTIDTNWKKNILTLLVEAGSIVNDVKSKNWENIGKDFGTIIVQLLLPSQADLMIEQFTIPKDFKMDSTAFLIGFLESLGNQNDISSLTDIVTCVTPNALFSVEEVVYSAIQQIENNTDYTQIKPIVIEAIKQLGQALEQIPDDLVSCGISETLIDRVKEFISLCKNSKQLESTIDANWKKNIFGLLVEAGSLINDIKAKNWENIGKDFGTIVDEVLLPSQADQMVEFFDLKQEAAKIAVDPQNFILGTLIGLTGNQKVAQMFSNTECFASAQINQIKAPITQIITLIKNKQYLQIVTEFGTILKNLISNLKELPSQLSSCGMSVDLVSEIKADFEKLKNPIDLAKSMFGDLMNDKSLVLEYSSLMEQNVEKNDWLSVGMFFGELLEKMFIEPQQSADELLSFFSIKTDATKVTDGVRDFVYGIIGGVSTSDDADSLFTAGSCAFMNDIDQMLPTIKNMFAVIKNKDYAELITYMIDMVKGIASEFELMTLQMKQCGATDAQVEKMQMLVQGFKDPKKTLSYLWGNINSNQLVMMTLFKSMFSDLKSKNFLQFGYDFGQILAQVYFGQNSEDELMSFISLSDIKTDAYNDFMFVHNGILDFSLGFIGGYSNNADFQSLITAYGCMEMNHINLLVDPVKSLMSSIKAKNWEGIITQTEEIIVDISTLMQNIPDQLLACGVSQGEQAKFEMLKNSLKNPMPLLSFFFNNIKSNAQDILLTAEQMIMNFQSKDFNDAGWQFGTIMQTIIMGQSQTSQEELMSFFSIQDGAKKVETEVETVALSMKDKIETIGLGFISGLSESQQAQNIFNNLPCLISQGFTNVIPAFENVINAVKQKQFKAALSNLMEVGSALFYAYINVPTQLQICGLDEQDVEILANYINFFQQPIETIKLISGNAKQNEVELLLLAQQIFESVKNKDLQNIGLLSGIFFDNIFLGPTQQYDPTQDEETMMLSAQDQQLIADGKSFLTGFFTGLQLENAEQSVECVGEEEVTLVYKQFKGLITTLSQNMNIFNIQSVLTKALGQFTTDVQTFKNIPNELIQCGLTPKSISSLTQLFDLFDNKSQFESAIKTDIEQNGLNLLDQMFSIVQDFNNQNWQSVGQGLGSMLFEMTQVKPQKSSFQFLTK